MARGKKIKNRPKSQAKKRANPKIKIAQKVSARRSAALPKRAAKKQTRVVKATSRKVKASSRRIVRRETGSSRKMTARERKLALALRKAQTETRKLRIRIKKRDIAERKRDVAERKRDRQERTARRKKSYDATKQYAKIFHPKAGINLYQDAIDNLNVILSERYNWIDEIKENEEFSVEQRRSALRNVRAEIKSRLRQLRNLKGRLKRAKHAYERWESSRVRVTKTGKKSRKKKRI